MTSSLVGSEMCIRDSHNTLVEMLDLLGPSSLASIVMNLPGIEGWLVHVVSIVVQMEVAEFVELGHSIVG
eukprot:11279350-Prorocentrum_lima.AAC.1